MPDYTFHLESGPIRVSAWGPRNAIGWSDDWGRVHQLVTAGYAHAEHGGPGTYGHVDYCLSPACRPDAAAEVVRLFTPAPAVVPGQLALDG